MRSVRDKKTLLGVVVNSQRNKYARKGAACQQKSSKGIRFRVALLIVFLSLHLLEEAPCGSTGYSLNPWIGDWN